MELSVIVCTKDRRNDLEKLMDSLCDQTRLPDELIIIDASKNDNTKQLVEVAREKELFEIVYNQTSPGLTCQRNIGVHYSKGQYIFFFDDDVVLENDFLEVIYNTFQQLKVNNVAGIMGRITNIPEKQVLWERLYRKIFFLSDLGKGRVKQSGLPSIKVDNKLSFVESLSGNCMAYQKKVFDEFEFDENLKEYAYLEDVDFSYRVGKKYNLLYQPQARLQHFPTTYKTADSKLLRKMFVQNQRYLYHKNLPQNLSHKLSFWTSVIGNLIYNGIINRDGRACRGIVEGILDPLKW